METWIGRLEVESREVVEHRDAIVELLDLKGGMRVADVGSGTGLFVQPLSEGVGSSGKVWAVELAPKFLAHLRAQFGALSNVQFVEATEKSAGLEAGSVELAFMCNVYHHLEYPSTYMRGLAASIAPGGRLVLVDFERVEGVTTERMLKHIRADKETVTAEIESAGWVLARELDLLEENYVLEFVVAKGSGP